MPKVTLLTINSLDNPSAVQQLNTNFTRLSQQIDLLLSRDGESPNQMAATLDVNANSIINLPSPTQATEPARHGDIQTYVDQASASATAAAASAASVVGDATAAAAARTGAEAALASFQGVYIGEVSTRPTVDGNGNAVTNGDLIFYTPESRFEVFVSERVVAGTDTVIAGTDNVRSEYWDPLPLNRVRAASDVAADPITNGQTLEWNAGQAKFIPLSLPNYDLSFFFQSTVDPQEILTRFPVNRAITIPTNLGTSAQMVSRTAPAASISLSFRKNDVEFGTVTFASGQTTGSATVTSTAFAAGDILSVVAPSGADNVISDIGITFTATKA